MVQHEVYRCIVSAVRSGSLKEPFTKDDFRETCPNFGDGTYNAFLDKHSVGNPGGYSELFERVAPGKFKLVKLIKYDI